MKRYDSVVIGAGPAGVAATLYLARFGAKVAMVEKMAPGGLLLQTLEIENYPGFAKPIKGYELADAFSAQLDPYPNIDRITDTVTELDLHASPKKIRLGETWLEADTVILCAGVRYRKLGLPDEDRFLGKGLSHCALCDGHFFRGQNVGVVGGGNSALEESLYLSKIVQNLHLIHRREEFRGAPIYQDRLRKLPNVTLECCSVVSKLHGSEFLEGVTLKRVHTGQEEYLPLSGLFVFIGFEPVKEFLPAGLSVDDSGFIMTDLEMCTNIPGVFAAGDIRAKRCRQVVTAAGDGATAANSAYLYLEQQHG